MRRGIVLGAALALLYKDAEGQKRRAFPSGKARLFTRPRGRQMIGGILQIRKRKSRHSFRNNGFFWYARRDSNPRPFGS